MNEEHRAPVQETLETMHVIDAVAQTDDAVPLGTISDAIAARRVVRLTYSGENDDHSPDTTVRDVEPMGVLRAGDA